MSSFTLTRTSAIPKRSSSEHLFLSIKWMPVVTKTIWSSKWWCNDTNVLNLGWLFAQFILTLFLFSFSVYLTLLYLSFYSSHFYIFYTFDLIVLYNKYICRLDKNHDITKLMKQYSLFKIIYKCIFIYFLLLLLLLLLFLISIACLLPSAHANIISSSVNTNEYPELDDNIQTQLLLQFVNNSLMGHSSKACV